MNPNFLVILYKDMIVRLYKKFQFLKIWFWESQKRQEQSTLLKSKIFHIR